MQSFDERELTLMNRAHNAEEASKCLQEAVGYFSNISMDLIYGIPNQSDQQWVTTIEKALSYGIPHISSYALTVEPKTALEKFIAKGVVPPVNDEQAQRQFLLLVDTLEAEGFVNYEISNFGKPGYFSKNNSAYWQGKSYLGIGPSAHSFDGKKRGWNINNNHKYIASLAQEVVPITYETLSTKDRFNEYIMTGLRTIWGVSFAKINTDFGTDYSNHLKEQSKKYIQEHLLFEDEGVLRATKKGKFLVDGIAADLFLLNLK